MIFFDKFKIVVSLGILLLFSSCSGAVPKIGQIIWQVNFLQAPLNTTTHMELSVFTLVDDEDGISDIESIYLINDVSELFWKLTPNIWAMKVLSGKNWIGSNSIKMNDNSNLPKGKYRVLVIDKAGERDERIFNIPENMLKLPNSLVFPKLTIGSDIGINSAFSDNTLWIYDDSMHILKNIKIKSGKISLSIINKDTSNKARWVSLYSFNSETGTGLIKGPYPLPPLTPSHGRSELTDR